VGAKLGILIKGGEALEIASTIDTIIFDKTGTVTKGKPAVVDFLIMDNPDVSIPKATTAHEYLLWLFASLERSSEHPLARAVVEYAEKEIDPMFLASHPFVQPSDFKASTGRGTCANISKRHVAIGNRAFVSSLGMTINPAVEQRMAQMEIDGKTAIVAAVDSRICVVMGIADELKADAIETISQLREQLGVDIWLVTGDNARTANAICRRLNIPADHVISEALPAAKVEKVRQLQQKGRVVAMVGDGINDSPALAYANVGISMGTGTAIAAEASDMVLVKGNVSDVFTALHLSRCIFRRIQWNFLWALLYNCLAIPIACGVFYPFVHARLPPTVAALAMALSSISVVLSSLSLRLYKPPTAMQNVRRHRGSTEGRSQLVNESSHLLTKGHLTIDTDQTEFLKVIGNKGRSNVEIEDIV
jgi:Cu+-exporting ATPase